MKNFVAILMALIFLGGCSMGGALYETGAQSGVSDKVTGDELPASDFNAVKNTADTADALATTNEAGLLLRYLKTEIDTVAEMEAIWSVDIVTLTEVDTEAEMEALWSVDLLTTTSTLASAIAMDLSTYNHMLTLGTNGSFRVGSGSDYFETVNDSGTIITRPVGSAQMKLGTLTIATDAVAIQTGTTADDDAYLAAYDVDGTAYENMLTLKAGNTPYGYLGGGTNGWRWDAAGNLTAVGTGDIDLPADSVDDADLNTTETISFMVNGGGSAITTGVKGYIPIDFACTITQVSMLADQSTSTVIDIWVDTYANYPPTDADTITAAAVPTITTATKSQDATLTGWTTGITAGDILGFNVDSNDNAEIITISLEVTR